MVMDPEVVPESVARAGLIVMFFFHSMRSLSRSATRIKYVPVFLNVIPFEKVFTPLSSGLKLYPSSAGRVGFPDALKPTVHR
jgi:hypothetical protein